MQQRGTNGWEKLGLEPDRAARLVSIVEEARRDPTRAPEAWARATREALPGQPFAAHKEAFAAIYERWPAGGNPPPAWSPGADERERSNLAWALRDRRFPDYAALHRWSVTDRAAFWEWAISRLGIRFRRQWDTVLDPASSVESPRWLPGARLNIVESCFQADGGATAVVYQRPGEAIRRASYGDLDELSDRVARGASRLGIGPGDPVAVDLPLMLEAVAIYLGLLKSGAVPVSIADSFAPAEIATRIRIAKAKIAFTQDVLPRGGKELPLYAKVIEARAPRTVVVGAREDGLRVKLREGDLAWSDFLAGSGRFEAVDRGPDDFINILFSSGTTGDPKAIPWLQTTPIKCAMDAHFHHDTRPGDVLAWPTSLGWMMGPWLIFASLINRAAMALYYDAPHGEGFGRFVEDAKVTMLGVVPSLVKAWRQSDCMKGRDWSRLRLFSSTGECSNSEDYLYLMSLAGYRPVIEYCGGTEIGGGYITGSLLHPASPGTFSCPSLGLDLVILDEDGRETSNGELFLVPPSIGLSTRLLNRDHHEVYFEGTPKGPRGEPLRRHGDQMERIGNFFRGHGRVDDTMNLGGIKVSSAEIERVAVRVPGVVEAAAIAVSPPGGGPSELVLFLVTAPGASFETLRGAIQARIREELNPLFKIHDLRVVPSLPRTASNKVMRRELRASYQQGRAHAAS